MSRPLIVLQIALLSSLLASSALGQVTFTGVGSALPGWGSVPMALSADGSTVGGYAGNQSNAQAFRWTSAGGIELLGLPGTSFLSAATGVSADGTTFLVHSRLDLCFGCFRSRPYYWTEGGGYSLVPGVPITDTHSTRAYAMSDDASAIGGDHNSTCPDPSPGECGEGSYHGFAVKQGIFQGYGSAPWGFSANGTTLVTGLCDVYIGGDLQGTLPGNIDSGICTGISADGTTVVGFESSGTDREGFRWKVGDVAEHIGDLPGGSHVSQAQDVSDDGLRVVGWGSTAQGLRALLWEEGVGVQDISDLLTAAGVDLTGWTLDAAVAISGDGRTITGSGTNSQGLEEAWVAEIPLSSVPGVPGLMFPASVLLAGLLLTTALAVKAEKRGVKGD